jgi:hypothetical protein
MLFDTRNKNIYGLGVGISTGFEKLGHFLFKGGGGETSMYDNDIHTTK